MTEGVTQLEKCPECLGEGRLYTDTQNELGPDGGVSCGFCHGKGSVTKLRKRRRFVGRSITWSGAILFLTGIPLQWFLYLMGVPFERFTDLIRGIGFVMSILGAATFFIAGYASGVFDPHRK